MTTATRDYYLYQRTYYYIIHLYNIYVNTLKSSTSLRIKAYVTRNKTHSLYRNLWGWHVRSRNSFVETRL